MNKFECIKLYYRNITIKYKRVNNCSLYADAPILAHLLRCESLEVGNDIGGVQRFASVPNLTHE